MKDYTFAFDKWSNRIRALSGDLIVARKAEESAAANRRAIQAKMRIAVASYRLVTLFVQEEACQQTAEATAQQLCDSINANLREKASEVRAREAEARSEAKREGKSFAAWLRFSDSGNESERGN